MDTALSTLAPLPDLRVAHAYEAQIDPGLLPVVLPAPPLVPLALLPMATMPVVVPVVEDPPVDMASLKAETERCLAAASSLSLLCSETLSPQKQQQKKGISKKSHTKPGPRKHIATEDRMDNNVDKVLRSMGYVRRNAHSRNKEFKSALMVGYLEQIKESALVMEELDFVQSHGIVLEKQRELAYQYSRKIKRRATYADEYKRALQILASDEGCMFLARALANS